MVQNFNTYFFEWPFNTYLILGLTSKTVNPAFQQFR